MGLKWVFGEGQAGPSMGRCMALCMAWCMGDGDGDVVGVRKRHGYTTWIGEVGLGHWERYGLFGGVDGVFEDL